MTQDKAQQSTAAVSVGLEMSLNKIADAIQIPLTYCDGKIKGEAKLRLTTDIGFSVPLIIKAVKVFHEEHVGVIFHIRGNLYLAVSYFRKTSTVSAFLIDKSKLLMDGVIATPEMIVSRSMGLRQVLDGLGKAVVKSFYYKGDWNELILPA